MKDRCEIDRWHRTNGVAFDTCVPNSNLRMTLCTECFKASGAKLGVNRSQKYVRSPKGRWTNVTPAWV